MATKSDTLNVRMTPAEKAAMEKAGEKEKRKPSALAHIILTDWLKSKGHLKR